jgi:outer membrane protein
MKHSFTLAVLLASSALAVSAQTPAAPVPSAPSPAGTVEAAPAGPTKIAVIAFQAAVGQTNEFQRNFADLQKKYDPKRQQLKSLSDDVDARTKALQAQGDKLTDAERASRAKDIDDKKKQLDRSGEDAQNDFQQEMQELYTTTAQKIYDVMSTVAQQNGYTLVLDTTSQQTPVLFAVPATDITKQVIDAYNVKSGVPAPPQPAAGGAPAAAPRTPGTTAPRPAPQTPAGK